MKSNLNWQLVNLELSKKLCELGVSQKSVFWWCWDVEVPYLIKEEEGITLNSNMYCSAFSVAELGIRSKGITYGTYEDGIHWARLDMSFYSDRRWSENDTALEIFKDKNEANCRAKLRIYLIENSLI